MCILNLCHNLTWKELGNLTEESGINKQIFPVVSFELSFQERLRYGVKDDEGNKRAK